MQKPTFLISLRRLTVVIIAVVSFVPIAYAENYRLDILAEDLDYLESLISCQTEICYLPSCQDRCVIYRRTAISTDRERTRGLPCEPRRFIRYVSGPQL